MANITQDQLKEIVRKAPQGTPPADVVRGLLARGHVIEGLNSDKQEAVRKAEVQKGVASKVANFLGIEKIGTGIGTAANYLTGGTNMVEQGIQNLNVQQDKLLQTIRAKKARGEDTSRLEKQLRGAQQVATGGAQAIEDIGTAGLTNREVIGSAALLGLNVAAGGTLGAAGKATAAGAAAGAAQTGVRGAVTGAAQAALNTVPKLGQAMKIGAGVGAVGGAATGLEQNGDATDVITSAALGGLIGAGIPLATKLVSLGLQGAGTVTRAGYRGARNVATKTVEAAADKLALGKRATIAQQAGRVGEAQALRTGVDAQVVDFIQTAQGADKSAFKKMYDIAQSKKGNMRVQMQPKEVVGQTVLDRVTHIVDANKKAGEGIKKAVQAIGTKPLDITKEYGEITQLLKNNGVGITDKGQVYAVGRVADSDLPYYQKMLDYVRPDKKGKVLKTAQYIDERRGLLFDELNLAKSRQQPYTDKVDRVAEQYRTILMRPLENANPAYKEQNKLYAQTIQPLKEFTKLIGYKGRLEDINTKSLRTAEVAQRLLGNAADRPTAVLTAIENAALNTGYKPQTSVFDQILFSDLLENYFGTTQTRSLRGQVGRAGTDVARDVAGAGVDAAQGNVLGLISKGARFLVGNTDDDQIKALGQLLADEVTPSKIPVRAAPQAARAAGSAAYTQKNAAADITKGLRNVPPDILQMLK